MKKGDTFEFNSLQSFKEAIAQFMKENPPINLIHPSTSHNFYKKKVFKMTTTNEGSIIVVDLDLVPWCFCESCSVTIFGMNHVFRGLMEYSLASLAPSLIYKFLKENIMAKKKLKVRHFRCDNCLKLKPIHTAKRAGYFWVCLKCHYILKKNL